MYNKWVSCGLRSTAFESHPRPHWTRRARHLCVICSMCSLRIGRFSDKLENENGERPDLRSHTSYESGRQLLACLLFQCSDVFRKQFSRRRRRAGRDAINLVHDMPRRKRRPRATGLAAAQAALVATSQAQQSRDGIDGR